MRTFLVFTSIVLMCVMSCSSGKNNRSGILVLAVDKDFGDFTSEILRAEGFSGFVSDSTNGRNMNQDYLDKFSLVILAENAIGENAEKVLTSFVRHGGKLIAIRPVVKLAKLFGFEGIPQTVEGGYIRIDTSSFQGKGLTNKFLQFHGEAARYDNMNGSEIAVFENDSNDGFPAVVLNKYGQGEVIAFLYNLPKSIVFTRQGNPALAGIEKDGINGLRAMDLFTGGWVDKSKNILNQADEQMHLLSNCIQSLLPHPVPRFWYFPDSLRCVVTLTNDGETKDENAFEPQFRDVDSMNARMTIYIMETGKVSKAWTDKWTARGFEISGHPDNTAEAGDPRWSNVSRMLEQKQKEISDLYGLKMNTIVNHWFVWCGRDSSGKQDFAAEAEIEAAHGLAMDINYAHYDNNSVEGHFLGPLGISQGNFTGSGIPMKFAAADGKILDIYQLLNNVYDQQYNENKDPDGYFECFKGLMDRSLDDDVFSFISIKSHNDEYYFSKEPLMKMLEYSKDKGVPVWTASELLDFLRAKEEASFRDMKWSDDRLSFSIVSKNANRNGLTFFIPSIAGNRSIREVSVNGENKRFMTWKVKGNEYAFLSIQPGYDYQISVLYGK